MRRFLKIMFVVLCIAMSVSSVHSQDEEENKKFTVMVPMRDGAKLSTVMYLPEGNGPYPVILIRTPYGKKLMAVGPVNKFIPAGYAVVVQDTRGRFDSEGTQKFIFSTETQDGQDTINWLASQKWSDGRVGTYGPSAMGIVQYALAADAPKALKCEYVSIASANLPEHGLFHGNVFRLSLVSGWLNFTRASKEPLKYLYKKGADVQQLMDSLNWQKNAGNIHIPIVHIGGWYDIFSQGILDAYTAIQEKGGAGAKGKQKLVMGPWTHLGAGLSLANDFVFSQSEEFLLDPVDWFDRCIKGEKGGVDGVPTVQYYTMDDVSAKSVKPENWKKAKQWAPKSTSTIFYLQQDKMLAMSKPKEKNAVSADRQGALNFESDPKNPVPFLCGAELIQNAGTCDQRKVEKRNDVLLFTSEPLKENMEITGSVQVVVYISSTGKDTDVTAKLTDVYPDGRSMLIVDGIQRARYRDGWEKESLLEAGKVYKLVIKLGTTSVVFQKGHQIRVAVASSNFPRFLINPNTGKDLELSPEAVDYIYKSGTVQYFDPSRIYDELVKVQNTLYLGISNPSYIVLPVVK